MSSLGGHGDGYEGADENVPSGRKWWGEGEQRSPQRGRVGALAGGGGQAQGSHCRRGGRGFQNGYEADIFTSKDPESCTKEHRRSRVPVEFRVIVRAADGCWNNRILDRDCQMAKRGREQRTLERGARPEEFAASDKARSAPVCGSERTARNPYVERILAG